MGGQLVSRFGCVCMCSKAKAAKYAAINKRAHIFEINKRKYKAGLKAVCLCMRKLQLGLINRLWHSAGRLVTSSLENKMAAGAFPLSHKIADNLPDLAKV